MFVPPPDEALAPPLPVAPPPPPVPAAVSKALGSAAEPRRGRYIRTWLGTSRGEQGRTRVTFVWEPLPPVPGVALRRVALPKDSPRGGLMTQAAVLKVTANGTTTERGTRATRRVQRCSHWSQAHVPRESSERPLHGGR